MAFAFRQRYDVETQLRRIAAEQIDKALEEAGGTSEPFGETVHRLRRRCKRLRGLLRLIRPRFAGFAAENRAVRDIAGALAGARDTAVTMETFEALVAYDAGRGGDAEIGVTLAQTVRQRLKESIGAGPEESERLRLMAEFRSAMAAARRRVEGWDMCGKGFEMLSDGLGATYRRLSTGLEAAREGGSVEAFHAWRKDAKYHWHHVDLLEAAAPDLLAGRKALLDRLGGLLGDHHNLAVLDETLDKLDGISAADLGVVRRLVGERQETLAGQAFALGRQLTAEKPSTLQARFAAYWQLLPRGS